MVLIVLSQYEIQKDKMQNGGFARRPFIPSATYATQLHLPVNFMKKKFEDELKEFEDVLDDFKEAKIIVEQEQEVVEDDDAEPEAVEVGDSAFINDNDGGQDRSYEVSSIAGHRRNGGFVEYKVLWKNYPESEATVNLPRFMLAL